MKREVKIGLIQMHSGYDTKANLKKALTGISKAADKGAQIITLPELFNAPYFCQVRDDKFFDLAEPIEGPTSKTLSKIAKEKKVVIITSIYEKTTDGKYYNTAVVIDADGSIAGKYRKIHIPDDPKYGYDEAYYFSAGDLGIQVIKTKYAKVAPQICYDQWFPEGARIAGLKGAEILFFPTAIGWPTSQREKWINNAENQMWKTIQISHGIANNCFVAAVNRVKLQDEIDFWGTSFVSDPFGQILGECSTDKEQNQVITCDLDLIKRKTEDWPFLNQDYNKAADKLK